ncbi:hypothetical protein F4819DRAFT_29516 [Hypoxylon fuscum]|nr:hypothetical protein F4819DRAFT_29516 [Hypoxylon fuscum]
MEFANHSQQERSVLDGRNQAADVIGSRKSSLTNNFSYPRPDTRLSRHGSSDSRSSLTSNGSVPGMTDSSDSETSFDEDYNTSASELWDSFWPDSAIVPGEQYPVLLRASQTPNYFTKTFQKHESQETDDTITISSLGLDSKRATGLSCDTLVPQHSPPRPVTRNGPVKYSVYPKPEPTDLLRITLPPRTSSLQTVPLSPPRRQPLKASKSSMNLKSSKLSHGLQPFHPIPSISQIPRPSTSAKSVPVSPAYPPPPPPRTLRAASSAINLRDRKVSISQARHQTSVPLSPLVQTTTAVLPEPQETSRPDLERYISIFEVDSDHESIYESNSFTKRIARGFHKKSASEKRVNPDRRGSADSDSQGSDKDKSKESSSRKRGGSLGRILGLRSR